MHKPRISLLLLLFCLGFIFAGCQSAPTSGSSSSVSAFFSGIGSFFVSEKAKVENWLNSTTGQSILADVDTAATAAINVAGGKNVSTELAILQAANGGLRSIETNTAPTAATIASTIQTFGGSSRVTGIIATPISNAIQSLLNAGVKPSTAVETVAAHVDTVAAAASAPAS